MNCIYRAGVIGLGKIGMLYDFEAKRPHPSSHVYAYLMNPQFKLVCVCDYDESKKTVLKGVSHDTEFFQDLDSFIEVYKEQRLDVVSICTPPKSHLDIVRKLIQNRVCEVIFCEKPLVSDLHEAKKLTELLEDNPQILVIPNISRRWNRGLQAVTDDIIQKRFGELEKINIRYTRGIYNTGSHLFDLLNMWTQDPIKTVFYLGTTATSAEPEKSFSFYFITQRGINGYAEAIDDAHYYIFDIDLYFTGGKIEFRNSGDDLFRYTINKHHLFEGFNELSLAEARHNLLRDSCLENAVNNIYGVLSGDDHAYCSYKDAIYPLRVAEALIKSKMTEKKENVKNG